MDDDVQQLLDFRLKMMRLGFAHEPDFITKARWRRQEVNGSFLTNNVTLPALTIAIFNC